jgi:hypothetical protein
MIHSGGACNKDKVQKMSPEYTITKDDADLVVERVQDHVMGEFEEAQH